MDNGHLQHKKENPIVTHLIRLLCKQLSMYAIFFVYVAYIQKLLRIIQNTISQRTETMWQVSPENFSMLSWKQYFANFGGGVHNLTRQDNVKYRSSEKGYEAFSLTSLLYPSAQ